MILKSTLFLGILSSVLLFPLFFENEVQAQTIGKDSISFKAAVQPSYAGDTLPGITPKSNFTFGSGSLLCPANDCKQELIGAFYSITSPASPAIQETLKIENKTASTPDIIKYSLIPFAGNFHIISIEENRKTANSVLMFTGDFGLGGGTTAVDAITNPEFKYSVTGTFDNVTKVLKFEGERITS